MSTSYDKRVIFRQLDQNSIFKSILIEHSYAIPEGGYPKAWDMFINHVSCLICRKTFSNDKCHRSHFYYTHAARTCQICHYTCRGYTNLRKHNIQMHSVLSNKN